MPPTKSSREPVALFRKHTIHKQPPIVPLPSTMNLSINDQQAPQDAPSMNTMTYALSPKDLSERKSPESSLERLLSRSTPSLTVRSAMLEDCKRRRKARTVCFQPEIEKKSTPKEEDDNPYGYDLDFVPPPPKKRRMQRRNSKTPAMLLAMNATLASLDFLDDNDERIGTPLDVSEDLHDFDDGIKLASELVETLTLRRRRSAIQP